ncbi:TIGR04222 domain-containing membrane protein [Streptomyces sp. NPDC057638]|uniref:TIGR04222 domain-containing membrane protein n=1 Tax=Streptomyces sp. NPDC057638 TaxID=3346190 RepID=UPI0036C2F566
MSHADSAVAIVLAIPLSTLGLLLFRAFLALGPRGGKEELRDPYEAAFLTGGPGRVADAAIAAMEADGRLEVGEPGIVAVRRAEATHPVERAVLHRLEVADSGSLNDLRYALRRSQAVQAIGDGLAARRLLKAKKRARNGYELWAFWQCALCALGIPVVIGLSFMEGATGWPGSEVPFGAVTAPVLLVGALLGGWLVPRSGTYCTPAGRSALRRQEKDAVRDATPAWGVALKGAQGARNPVLVSLLAVSVAVPVGFVLHGEQAQPEWCGTSPYALAEGTETQQATGGGDGGSGGDGDGGGCGGCGGCGCGG